MGVVSWIPCENLKKIFLKKIVIGCSKDFLDHRSKIVPESSCGRKETVNIGILVTCEGIVTEKSYKLSDQ